MKALKGQQYGHDHLLHGHWHIGVRYVSLRFVGQSIPSSSRQPRPRRGHMTTMWLHRLAARRFPSLSRTWRADGSERPRRRNGR